MLLFLAFSAVAQEPTISLSVSPKTVRVGQPIHCEWIVEASLQSEIILPDHPPPMDNLQVLDQITTPIEVHDGRQRVSFIVIAEAINAADAHVPSITVHIQQSGKNQSYTSKPVDLPFESFLSGGEELQDLKPDTLPWSIQTVWLAGVLVVVSLVIIATLVIKPRAPISADSAISATDGAIAIRAIDVNQPSYDFYEAVNGILARYLNTRYHISSRPTTAGICRAVERAVESTTNSEPAEGNTVHLVELTAVLADDDTRRYRAGSEQDAERRYAETIAVWLEQEARATTS